MLEFLFGLTIGIYIGTFYNCKPIIAKVNDVVTRINKDNTCGKPPFPCE